MGWVLNGSRAALIDDAGQSLVEVALALPILLMLLLGLVDGARAYYFAGVVANAAREGARIAAADPTLLTGTTTCTMPSCSGNIFQETAARLSSALLPGAVINLKLETPAEAIARDAVTGYCNRTVTVAVSGNYSYFFYKLLGWMGKTVPNAVTIARSTTMRWEPQAGCGFS